MTAEQYTNAKAACRQYETLMSERERLKRVKDTADTLAVRDRDGNEIELTGAEPLSALATYVTEKIAEIDKSIASIGTVDAVETKEAL